MARVPHHHMKKEMNAGITPGAGSLRMYICTLCIVEAIRYIIGRQTRRCRFALVVMMICRILEERNDKPASTVVIRRWIAKEHPVAIPIQ
jgi:hypothetical protein